MNTSKVVESLRKEAKINSAFNAVCCLFALRQRTRYKLTIQALTQSMLAEGFHYKRSQYEYILKFMADLGLGSLYKDAKGRITALDNIKYSLQSIGKAAVEKTGSIQQQNPAHKFRDLPGEAVSKIHDKVFIEKPATDSSPVIIQRHKVVNDDGTKNRPPIRKKAPYPAFLTVLIEGKPVTFAGPSNVTADNLAEFLTDFKRVGNKRDQDTEL